jgi:hypothetical protein
MPPTKCVNDVKSPYPIKIISRKTRANNDATLVLSSMRRKSKNDLWANNRRRMINNVRKLREMKKTPIKNRRLPGKKSTVRRAMQRATYKWLLVLTVKVKVVMISLFQSIFLFLEVRSVLLKVEGGMRQMLHPKRKKRMTILSSVVLFHVAYLSKKSRGLIP